MSIAEGRKWVQKIRAKIHTITVAIAREKGKSPLLSPSKLAPKNITRWVKASAGFPKEYEVVVNLGIMSENDMWYFLDCEACFEAIGQILEGKRLANLPRAIIDRVVGPREVTYDVGPNLAVTLDSPDLEEEMGYWEIPWTCSEDEESDSQPWWCRRCEITYYSTVDGVCPECEDD